MGEYQPTMELRWDRRVIWDSRLGVNHQHPVLQQKFVRIEEKIEGGILIRKTNEYDFDWRDVP